MNTITTKNYLFLIPFLLVSNVAIAATLTVNNSPAGAAMYNDFPDAYNAATDGDTILISASETTYSTTNIYKRLTIIGEGYLLSENSIPGLTTQDTKLTVNFLSDTELGDSSGSKIIGITGLSSVFENVDNVEFKRCKLVQSTNTSRTTIRSTIVMRGCYISSKDILGNETDLAGINIYSSAAGSLIANSIIEIFDGSERSGIPDSETVDIYFKHCVFTKKFIAPRSMDVSNSIFAFTNPNNFDADNVTLSNCLSIGWTLPAGSENIDGAGLLLSDVFLNAGSIDEKWQLAVGSPAIGVEEDDVDMGAFGGANPYILSGLPGIPRLTRLDVPTSATNVNGVDFEAQALAYPE